MINQKLIIITPVYEDKDVAKKLFKEIEEIYTDNVFIVAINDGSVHYPLEIDCIESANLPGVVIKLKKNVGHQRSIAVGLCYVEEKMNDESQIVVMDSDGEDKPESIKELLVLLESKENDLIVASRKSRVETVWFRFFYIIYKWIFKLLSGRKINFGNYVALKPLAVKRLVSMQELWIHVASCILMSKLRIETCSIARGERYAGMSKSNFIGQVLHGFRALMVFSEDVLVRVGMACALVAFLSVLGGMSAVILKVFGFATPGWFSVALGILLLVFLQTGALTLITLMLTGVIKSGSISPANYKDYVDNVKHTKNNNLNK